MSGKQFRSYPHFSHKEKKTKNRSCNKLEADEILKPILVLFCETEIKEKLTQCVNLLSYEWTTQTARGHSWRHFSGGSQIKTKIQTCDQIGTEY